MLRNVFKSAWAVRVCLVLAFSILSGMIAVWVVHFPFRNFTGLSSNPYTLYEKSITARIGAYAPYAFLDKGGMLDGYVIDLTHAISRVMSARIILLSRKLDDPEEYKDMQETDVVLCMVKTPLSSQKYDFSSPYATHTFAVFARKGTAPLKEDVNFMNREDVVINSDGVYYDLHRQGSGRKCGLVSSAEEALRKVDSGEFLYTVMETYIGKDIIEEQTLQNSAMLSELDEKVEYAFAVRRGNEEVLKIFTEGLHYLQSTGQFDKIQKKWLEKRFIITKSTRDSLIVYIVVALSAMLGLALLFLLWSHTLKQQVKQRSAELEAEIQERRRAEQMLRVSQKQLIQADKMAAVGTLASGVAHEINNPNGLLMLNLPILRDLVLAFREKADEEYRQNGDFFIAGMPYSILRDNMENLVNDCAHASLHIKSIVDDLKDFVRTDKEIWQEDFDINDVLKTSLHLLTSMIKKSTDNFSVSYAPSLPLMHGSAQKIEQVFLNIIINACQSLTNRKAALRIETRLELGAKQEDDRIVCRIQDEGCGINPEDMPYIFDPFYTTKREDGGTGLGLSICDTIVKGHGGSIEIMSHAGEGTSVSLRFPPEYVFEKLKTQTIASYQKKENKERAN